MGSSFPSRGATHPSLPGPGPGPAPSHRSSPLKGLLPPPPSACSQPRFLSHCQSTMAVIINGLSQCDSCGPLKIGLNNKILAYGNFFSSPAPSFSLPHFGLVMHANVSPPPPFPSTFLLMRTAMLCFPRETGGTGPPGRLALGKRPGMCDFCHLPGSRHKSLHLGFPPVPQAAPARASPRAWSRPSVLPKPAPQPPNILALPQAC